MVDVVVVVLVPLHSFCRRIRGYFYQYLSDWDLRIYAGYDIQLCFSQLFGRTIKTSFAKNLLIFLESIYVSYFFAC